MQKKEKNKVFSIIEVCSGIGATSLALKELEKLLEIKFRVLGISEIDEKAIQAYTRLHGPTFNFGDITKVDFSHIRCDILSFTSPCVNLSSLGNRTGFEEKIIHQALFGN